MHYCLRRLATTLAVALCLCIAPTAAFAGDKEDAEKLYNTGLDAYLAGDYTTAIMNFEKGFQLDANVMFLYNLSVSYWKIGNEDEALSNAQQAETKGGMPDDISAKNSARLLGIVIKRDAETAAVDISNAPPDLSCLTNADCEGEMMCHVQNKICVAPAPAPPGAEGPLSVLGYAGIGATAVGVGLLVGAVLVDGAVKTKVDEYNSNPSDALLDEINGQKTTGLLLLGGGVVFTAGGLGLLAYDLLLDDNNLLGTLELTPIVGPNHTGLAVSGAF